MNKCDRDFLLALEKDLNDLYWRACKGEDVAGHIEALEFSIYCYLYPDYCPD